MHLDAQSLSSFYEEPIGQVTRRLIFRRIRIVWPDVRGQRLLGYGYAPPYLKPFIAEAERVAALVPAPADEGDWTIDRPFIALGDHDALPFPDAMFDRVMIVHGLEAAESTTLLLRQIWRVMTPSGRILVIVPNRASLWAQVESSPFAQGRPFTRGQLDRLMRDSMFLPERWDTALFVPPLRSRRLVRGGTSWERFGRAIWPGLAGVHLLEASKSLYALTPPAKVRVRKTVLSPAAY